MDKKVWSFDKRNKDKRYVTERFGGTCIEVGFWEAIIGSFLILIGKDKKC